jgi:hypothetical protein
MAIIQSDFGSCADVNLRQYVLKEGKIPNLPYTNVNGCKENQRNQGTAEIFKI